MDKIVLLQPWWLLPASLLLVAFIVTATPNRSDWQRVLHANVLRYLLPAHIAKNQRNYGFLIAALACVALSNPVVPTADAETFRHTQGWIILADVSRSMSLTDVTPSRISAMRDAAIELASRANANSTTLIIYAGDAFIIAPPSFDTANFYENANLLEYGIIPSDGSNLTRALSLAWSVIDSSQLVNARLFILSDTGGFNTRSDAAIARLAALGHQTDLILFGSDDSTNAAPFDLTVASQLAESGLGNIIVADALGRISLNKLSLNKLNFDNSLLTQTGITTLRWSNQSHWILLLVLPLLLLMFYREIR